MKKVLKLAGIAAAAVAGLGFGYVVADKVTANLPAQVSARMRQWITSFVAFVTAVVSAVTATKLLGKFLGHGGPGITASVK